MKKNIVIVALLLILSMGCRLLSPTIPPVKQDTTRTVTVKPGVTAHAIIVISPTPQLSPSKQNTTSTATVKQLVTSISVTTTPLLTSTTLSSPTPLLFPSKQNLTSTAKVKKSTSATPIPSLLVKTSTPSQTLVVLTMTHAATTATSTPSSLPVKTITPSRTPVVLTMTYTATSATPSLSPTTHDITSTATLTLTPKITLTPTNATQIPLTRVFVKSPNKIVGAIRWDAWVGDAPTFGNTGSNRIGLAVERTLGPAHWNYRLPFFAVKLNKNKVQVRGNTQEIIDQEILYAADAGLDYWAFDYYGPGTGLDAALELYLNSSYQNKIKFSLILIPGNYLLSPKTHKILTKYFQMPNYQKVLNERPLLYIFGNSSLTQGIVDSLVASGGTNKPYIVYLGWSADQVATAIGKYGLDAGSAYAQSGDNGQSFLSLTQKAETGWDTYRLKGIKVIPWVTTGWDPRPRIETPNFWSTYPQNQWVQTAKPIEIANHLKNALKWNATYYDTAETNAVLIYSWNEFDEGGWLCPTLYGGTKRLDAIKKLWIKSRTK